MNKFLCIIIIAVCAINVVIAQSNDEAVINNYRLGVGPYLGFKMGINAGDVPQGIKNGVSAANMPDFGAQFYLPFQGKSKMGLILSAAYATYPYKLTYEGAGISTDSKYNFSYVALGADFFLSGFTIGFNYGFPSGAKLGDFDLSTDLIANMFEFKIGGNIPMIEDDLGRLNLIIQAGYFITGQYNDDRAIQGKNTNPASLMVGLSYLFNIDEKQE
jgi:hypothetical protein